MRAVLVEAPGGPEALTIGEAPAPAPGPGEVLVRTVASGVNRADVLQRQGHYPPPAGITDLIGLEASGVVEAVGDGVERWKAGDEVVALLAGGLAFMLVEGPAVVRIALGPGWDPAVPVLQVTEADLAHAPLAHKTARQRDGLPLQLVELVLDLLCVMGHVIAGDLKGIPTRLLQGCQLIPADLENFPQVLLILILLCLLL